MRSADVTIPRTAKGRQALTRSLHGLHLRAYRFAQHRALTDGDRHWAARLIDHLTAALDVARGDGDLTRKRDTP